MYLLQKYKLPAKTMGNIAVNVTDGDSAVAGATVTLTDADSQTTSETTDENGAVLFEDIDNGNYTVSISKEGYATETTSVVVAGEDITVNATLTAIGDLTITVKDSEDTPSAIEGATVTIGETVKTTDASGECTFTNMSYDDYSAEVSATGYITKTESIAFRSNHKSFTVTLTAS